MELNPRQKRYLRGLAQSLDPLLRVGKEGVTPGVLGALEELLEHHELVKVRVPKPQEGEKTETLASELAQSGDAALVGVVGFTFVLYRPNPKKKDRIDLPD